MSSHFGAHSPHYLLTSYLVVGRLTDWLALLALFLAHPAHIAFTRVFLVLVEGSVARSGVHSCCQCILYPQSSVPSVLVQGCRAPGAKLARVAANIGSSVTGCEPHPPSTRPRSAMSTRPASTYKTAWDALGVESGEESDVEILDETPASQPERYDAPLAFF